jgi:hypothetical protein
MKFGIRLLRTSYTALMVAQSSEPAGNASSGVSFNMNTFRLPRLRNSPGPKRNGFSSFREQPI